MMKREEVLNKAKSLVNGDRDVEYGGPEESFTGIATLWNAYFEASGLEIYILPYQVTLMLDLLKTARIIKSAGQHQDSWVDKAGYAACGSEVAGKGKPA